MNLDPAAAREKLSHFTDFTAVYKRVNQHAITIDILIPKELRPGKRPLLVRLHVGGSICNNFEPRKIFVLMTS